MRFPALLLLGLSPALFAAEAEKPEIDYASINPVAPLVIVGEGWSQQFIIKNVDDEDAATGALNFFNRDGHPWQVELLNRGTANQFFVTLAPGQMAIYETAVKTDPQELGWAEFDLECCALVHAQSVFRKQTPDRPDLMASIVLGGDTLKTLHIPFDNRDGKFAGVGVVPTDACIEFSLILDCTTFMRWRFKDENGNVFKEFEDTQRNRTLRWFSLSADHPETTGRFGSIEISGLMPEDDVQLVGFSLQFAPNGAFTVITTYER